YEGAASYIPGLKSAEVLARPDKDTYDVRYTSAMPVAGETRSTVRNTYTRENGALVVRWRLIEADMADESTGELRVEPNGAGSILRYTNFVRPKSSLAAIAKFAALSEVKKTVAALRAESEKRAN
ncbi:MAG: SRPBCC family protein, partial [Terrimicrobiaceae bacterium]|nr:SRPBCC family protein [Terrimicrobiaceae bacterium]